MSVQKVFDAIDPFEYYSKVLGPLPREDADGNILVRCCLPPHDDLERSLSINIRSRGGLFNCFGCGAAGNLIQFHDKLRQIGDTRTAANEILAMFNIDPSELKPEYIDERSVDDYHSNLMAADRFLEELRNQRGIDLETIKYYRLGLEPKSGRITIPIRDAAGNVVNFRRWLPKSQRKSDTDEATKCISVRGRGDNALFPIEALRGQEIIICEGELDALMLHSHGFNAITSTGGANAFDKSWPRMFRDKDVVLLMDNDLPGREASDKRRELLYPFVRSVKEVFFAPSVEDKDVTDYWFDDPDTFKERCRTFIDNGVVFIKQDFKAKLVDVNLFQAARSDLVGKRLRVRALVAGKEDRPLGMPSKVKLSCTKPCKGCTACPYITNEGESEFTIEPSHPLYIDLLTSDTSKHPAIFAKMFGITCLNNKNSDAEFEVSATKNVEEVRLIPEIEMSDDKIEYLIRPAYVCRYGMDYNELYDLIGYTVVDPKTNYITHVFEDAEKVSRSDATIRSADLYVCDGVEKTVGEHLSIFKVEQGQTLYAKLDEIYNDLQVNVTKIVHRNDIIRAVDLLYHSAERFIFDGEQIIKGWMDVLILGDTACGKSKTVERMRDHYQAAEIYSGENISKVGIIGGYINVTGNGKPRYMLGVWPLNNGRCVFIDELSGMSKETFSELTMLRDHGIAESTKQAQRAKFPARVRFGMMSNPRGDKKLAEWTYPIEAMRELVGADADISRFDMVVIAAGSEVTAEDIHQDRPYITPKYTSDLCNLMVRWAWNRKPGQIRFTKAAIALAKELAEEMGNKYHPSLPLVLGQSQRIKLARVAIAIATRLYNTVDGETVEVDAEHIEAAKTFMYQDYDKPTCGYLQYSITEKRKNVLPNPVGLQAFLDEKSYMLTECLLTNRVINKKAIEDHTGEPITEVTSIMRELLRFRAFAPKGNNYFSLTPSFIKFLSTYKHPHKDDYFDDREDGTEVGL